MNNKNVVLMRLYYTLVVFGNVYRLSLIGIKSLPLFKWYLINAGFVKGIDIEFIRTSIRRSWIEGYMTNLCFADANKALGHDPVLSLPDTV